MTTLPQDTGHFSACLARQAAHLGTLWTGLLIKARDGRSTDSFSSKLSNLRSAVPQACLPTQPACLPTQPACQGALHTSVVASRGPGARLGLSKALHCLRSVLSNNIPQQLTLDRDQTCNVEAATDQRQASRTCAQSGVCKDTCHGSCVSDRPEQLQRINTRRAGPGQKAESRGPSTPLASRWGSGIPITNANCVVLASEEPMAHP